jgi:hypothetical protein
MPGGTGNVSVRFQQQGILASRSVISIAFSPGVVLSRSNVTSTTLLYNCSDAARECTGITNLNFTFSIQFNAVLGIFNARVQLMNIPEFSNISLRIGITGVQNPQQGGWWEIIPSGGIVVSTQSNLVMFRSLSPVLASLDPRTRNLSNFDIQDSRGLQATGSTVNLTLRLFPTRNVNSTGAIQVMIPSNLQIASGSTLSVVGVLGSQLQLNRLRVSVLNVSSTSNMLSVQYIDSIRASGSPLLTAFTNSTIILGPFTTPVAQPELRLSPFRVRTVTQADDALYPIDWDSPESWGSQTTRARVVEQSAACCTGIQLTSMGPLAQIASLNVQFPIAGAISNMIVSFVTPTAISGGTGIILLVLPSGFLTCSEADATGAGRTDCPSSRLCLDQNLVVNNISIRSLDSVETFFAGQNPWTVQRCGNAAPLPGTCAVPPVSSTDCSSTSPGQNVVYVTPLQTISAGLQVQIYLGGITLPAVIGFAGSFSISLRPVISVNQWNQATVNVTNLLNTLDIPGNNAFIGPQDTTVSAVTSYNIFFLSLNGLPTNGWIEIVFPEGIRLMNVALVDSTITGNFSGATSNTRTLGLQAPASTQSNLYTNRNIYLLPTVCILSVARASTFPAAPQYLPMVVTWNAQYPGGKDAWASWFAGGCYKVSRGITTRVSRYTFTTPQLVREAAIDATIDSTILRWFALSNQPDNNNAVNIGNNTVRIGSRNCNATNSCFRFPFPARGIINITLSGIMNGPSMKFPTGTYQIRTYTPEGSLLERLTSISGSTYTSRVLAAEIIVNSTGAHDNVGCTVVIRVDSTINSGSTIEVKFSDLSAGTDVRLGFSGANTFLSVQSVSSIAELARISSLFNSSVRTGTGFVQVNATMLSQVPSVCAWNSSVSGMYSSEYCTRIYNTTAKILLNSAVPSNNLIALRLSGQLRNPARPGIYFWPADAVKIFQWDSVIADDMKTLTADSDQAYSPAQLTLISSGLVNQNVSIGSGRFENSYTKISVPYVNQSTSIEFTLVSGSSIRPTDSIIVVVPPIFSFFDSPGGAGPVLSILGPVVGLPGTLAVKNITRLSSPQRGLSQITLARCTDAVSAQTATPDCFTLMEDSGLDQTVRFTLGPFVCRSYSAINFNEQTEPGNLFGVFVVDQANRIIEGSEQLWNMYPPNWNTYMGTLPGPTVLPSILEIEVDISDTRSAAVSNVTCVFQPTAAIQSDSEIFIFLPPAFSVVRDQNVVISQGFSKDSLASTRIYSGVALKEVTREVLDSKVGLLGNVSSVCLRIQGSNIPANTPLIVQISNVLNPMGGLRQQPQIFTVATAKGCANVSAMSCFWLMDFGKAASASIQPGAIQNAQITMSSISAGNQIMLSVRFSTSNPFPPFGMVEVILPEGYLALPNLQYCSALLTKNSECLLPCLNDSIQYCPLGLTLNPASISTSNDGIQITISSAKSSALFTYSNLPTFPNWSFPLSQSLYQDILHTPGYGGTSIAFNISAVRIRQVSGSAGYFFIRVKDFSGNSVDQTDSPGVPSWSGDLIPNKLLMTLIQPLSHAAGELTGFTIQFTTSNPIPPLGAIYVVFPRGFDLSKSYVPNIEQNSGLLFNSSTDQILTLINTEYKPALKLVRFFVSSLANIPVVGPTDRFQIITFDSAGDVIDQDIAVLNQNIVPGILSRGSVLLQSFVAGSKTDITANFSPSFDLSQGDLVLGLPASFTLNLTGNARIPVKRIQVNSKQSCPSVANPCLPSNVSKLPAPVPGVFGMFPVSAFVDQNQAVTIFGANFGQYNGLVAKFGNEIFPAKFSSTSEIEVKVNTSAIYLSRAGMIQSKGCNVSIPPGPLEEVSVLNCSSRLCSMTEPHCQNIDFKLSVPVDVSFDGLVFTSSKVQFAIYRKLNDACPNDCGGAQRGVCKDLQCTCKFPYDGIDCGIAPTPLTIQPNFGPLSGMM